MQEGRSEAWYMREAFSNGVRGLHNAILHPFPDREEKRGENENLKPNQAGLQTRGRRGGKKGK
jgi:hypothetical protein